MKSVPVHSHCGQRARSCRFLHSSCFFAGIHYLIADCTISHFLTSASTLFFSLLCLFLRSRKDSLESESSAAIVPHELVRTRQLESVHLKFNQESGTLLPLCLRYRTILSPTPTRTIFSLLECPLRQTDKKQSKHSCWMVWQNVLMKHQSRNTDDTSFSEVKKKKKGLSASQSRTLIFFLLLSL